METFRKKDAEYLHNTLRNRILRETLILINCGMLINLVLFVFAILKLISTKNYIDSCLFLCFFLLGFLIYNLSYHDFIDGKRKFLTDILETENTCVNTTTNLSDNF